jgi:type II secretory pathway component PulK
MIHSRRKHRRKHTEGVALLLALLFVVILAAIVTDFMYKMQVEATLVSNQNSDHAGYLAAKSGVATGMSILHADRLKDLDEEGGFGGMYDGLD